MRVNRIKICFKSIAVGFCMLQLVATQSTSEGECQRVTLRGCECANQWLHDQLIFTGCARTNDKETEWCQIRPGSCKEDLSNALLNRFVDGTTAREDEPEWDYCTPGCKIPDEEIETTDPCSTFTSNGCRCLQTWEFLGNAYSGCANPDTDSAGSWCIIEPQTCSTASGPVTVFPVKGLQFDYCSNEPECQAPSPPLLQSPLSTQQPQQSSTENLPQSNVVLAPYDPSGISVYSEFGVPFSVEYSYPDQNQEMMPSEEDAYLPGSNDMFLQTVAQIIGSNSGEGGYEGIRVSEEGSGSIYQQGLLESSQDSTGLQYTEEVQESSINNNDDFDNMDPAQLLQDTIMTEDTDVAQALMGFTNMSVAPNQDVAAQLKQIQEDSQNSVTEDSLESLTAINSTSLHIMLPIPINDGEQTLPTQSNEGQQNTQISTPTATPAPTPTPTPTTILPVDNNSSDSYQQVEDYLLLDDNQDETSNQLSAEDTNSVQNASDAVIGTNQGLLVKQPATLVEDVENEQQLNTTNNGTSVDGVQLSDTQQQPQNCSELLNQSAYNISAFVSICEKLNMLEEMSGTVFFPTNDAIESFFEEQQITLDDLFKFHSNLGLLQKVLDSHVIPNASILSIVQLQNIKKLQTQLQQQIKIKIDDQEQVFVIPPFNEAENALVLGQIQNTFSTCGFNSFIVDEVIIPNLIA